MSQISDADEKREKYYHAIRSSRFYRAGEWFSSTDLACNFSSHNIRVKSAGLYLQQLFEAGELERKTHKCGSYRLWRKAKKVTPHMRFRTVSNEELGIPDATLGWH